MGKFCKKKFCKASCCKMGTLTWIGLGLGATVYYWQFRYAQSPTAIVQEAVKDAKSIAYKVTGIFK